MEFKFDLANKKLRKELNEFFGSSNYKDVSGFKYATKMLLDLKRKGHIFRGYKEFNNFELNELESVIQHELNSHEKKEQNEKDKKNFPLSDIKIKNSLPVLNERKKEVIMLLPEDYDSMIDIAIMTGDIEWRNELLMKASGING